MGNKVLIQDLAEQLAAANHLSKNEADNFVKVFFDTLVSVLETEHVVKIKGLGTFKLVDVDSRESVDVNTGERIRIEGHQKVSFTPEAALKKRINKPFEQFETVIINDGVDMDSMESLDNQEVAAAAKQDIATEIRQETSSANDDDIPSEPTSNNDTPKKIEHVISPMQMQLEIKKDAEGEEAEKQAEALAHEKSENRWLKVVLSLLVAVLLCVVSYFAGYYKVLCPGCDLADEGIEVPVRTVKKTTLPVENKPVSQVDSTRTDSVTTTQGAMSPKDRTTEKDTQPKERKVVKEDKSFENKALTALDPQVSYRMVSTLAVHEMKTGENLYRIAQKYYGSKSFAVYIIRYNGFEDPNVVHVGTRVKLPLLKK